MEWLRRQSARRLVAFALLGLAAATACSREPKVRLPPAGTPAIPPGLNRAYALETRPSKAISAVYSCSVRAPKLVARECVLFAPRPPDLPGQRIVGVRTSPAGETTRDLGPLGRPLLRARVSADSPELRKGIAFQVRVEAQLFSCRLVRRDGARSTKAVKALKADERRRALGATSQYSLNPPPMVEDPERFYRPGVKCNRLLLQGKPRDGG
ncbi:MAG: hypothetical protein ACYTKD_31640, partial [Planctomycetota bacterium]